MACMIHEVLLGGVGGLTLQHFLACKSLNHTFCIEKIK